METGEEPPAGETPAGLRLPSVAYEREEGVASWPLPRSYRRREPERTVLHRVVRENLATLVDETRARSPDGNGYPPFVERELERYLACGLLSCHSPVYEFLPVRMKQFR